MHKNLKTKILNFSIIFFIATIIILIAVAIFFDPYIKAYVGFRNLDKPHYLTFKGDIKYKDQVYIVEGNLMAKKDQGIGKVFVGTNSIRIGLDVITKNRTMYLRNDFLNFSGGWYKFDLPSSGQSKFDFNNMTISYDTNTTNQIRYDFAIKNFNDKVKFDVLKGEAILNSSLSEFTSFKIYPIDVTINDSLLNFSASLDLQNTLDFNVDEPTDVKQIDLKDLDLVKKFIGLH